MFVTLLGFRLNLFRRLLFLALIGQMWFWFVVVGLVVVVVMIVFERIF
jgi:hypothetical protein